MSAGVLMEPHEIKEEPLDDDDQPGPSATAVIGTGEELLLKQEIKDEIKQEPTEEPMADVVDPSTGLSNNLISYEDGQLVHNVSTDTGLDKKSFNDGWRICHLCQERTKTFYNTPVNFAQREAFLKRIIVRDDRDEARMQCVMGTGAVYFCVSHVAMRTVKLISDPPSQSSNQRYAYGRCYLCSKLSDKCYETPVNAQERKHFLKNIRVNTKVQFNKVQRLNLSSQRVCFCADHVMVLANLKKSVDSVTCNLCDAQTATFLVSPSDSKEAWTFFRGLKYDELTYEQKVRAAHFQANNYRVSMCKKHFKDPQYLQRMSELKRNRVISKAAPRTPSIFYDYHINGPVAARGELGHYVLNAVHTTATATAIVSRERTLAPQGPLFDPVKTEDVDQDIKEEPLDESGPSVMRLKPVSDVELHRAYDTSYQVYNEMKVIKVLAPTERNILDLAAIVMESVEFLESGMEINADVFERITRKDSKNPYLRLAFSLRVLIQRLLTERNPKAVVPSTSMQGRRDFQGMTSDEGEDEKLPPPPLEKMTDDTEIPLFKAPDPVKEEPKEIKVEEDDDYEVKAEPADEFADVKQEEPMVDVFCPTTGTSRTTGADQSLQGGIVTEKSTEFCPIITTNSKTHPVENIVAWRLSKPNATKPTPKTKVNKPTSWTQLKECYLCGLRTTQFYSTVTLEAESRLRFLDSILCRNQADRIRISALRSSRAHAYFCKTHIAKDGPKAMIARMALYNVESPNLNEEERRPDEPSTSQGYDVVRSTARLVANRLQRLKQVDSQSPIIAKKPLKTPAIPIISTVNRAVKRRKVQRTDEEEEEDWEPQRDAHGRFISSKTQNIAATTLPLFVSSKNEYSTAKEEPNPSETCARSFD